MPFKTDNYVLTYLQVDLNISKYFRKLTLITVEITLKLHQRPIK